MSSFEYNPYPEGLLSRANHDVLAPTRNVLSFDLKQLHQHLKASCRHIKVRAWIFRCVFRSPRRLRGSLKNAPGLFKNATQIQRLHFVLGMPPFCFS